jgi:hypothetical protein
MNRKLAFSLIWQGVKQLSTEIKNLGGNESLNICMNLRR